MPSVWDTATSLASGPRVQIQTSRCKESRLPFIGDDEQDTPKGTKARARTNARGQAQLTFQLPELAGAREDQEVDLEIRGTRGYFHNSLTSTLHFWRRAAILLSTDKPLYQPDQTLHMRALVLDDQDRKSTRLNSSHRCISYAVFCLKKKKQ